MRKALLLLAVLVAFSFPGSAELDSTISRSCPESFEPVVSMSHPNVSYNNIGTDGMYEYKVCVTGISQSSVDIACRGNTGFYISDRSTEAHFSEVKGYNLHVCTGNMVTDVKDTCNENETALFTVSNRINGFGRHIAGLIDGYDNVVCGSYSLPENVTVEMQFNLTDEDEAYFDDQQLDGYHYSSMAEFPYLVLQGDGAVSGIVSSGFLTARRDLEEDNSLRMRRDVQGDGVFIPLTAGDHEEVEDEEQQIMNQVFLNQAKPSFGDFPAGPPTIRTVLLRSDVDLESNITLDQGTHELELVKSGEGEVTIRRR